MLNDNDLFGEEIFRFSLFADCGLVPFEDDGTTRTHWLKMIVDKTHTIENNGTWELTKLHLGKKPIKVVYKMKYRYNGEINYFKVL